LRNSNVECFKCGKYGHYAKDCYLGKYFSCDKVGNFSKECRSESRKEEMIKLIEDVEEEVTLLMMVCSSEVKHMELKNSIR